MMILEIKLIKNYKSRQINNEKAQQERHGSLPYGRGSSGFDPIPRRIDLALSHCKLFDLDRVAAHVCFDGINAFDLCGFEPERSWDADDLAALGAELAGEMAAGFFGNRVVAAGKAVRGGVTEFGPGMHRDVALGEQTERGYALRLEPMRSFAEPGRAGFLGGVFERTLDERVVVEEFGRTAVELHDAMNADVGHFRYLFDRTPSGLLDDGRRS